MTEWTSVIRQIAPRAAPAIVEGLAAAMPECIKVADLNTPLRQAHFLAQLAHESAGFRTTTEYASGAAYNGRADLGNTQPGDGVRYKGRGLIQITGRINYKTMGNALGQDFINNPSLAAQFPWAALTAAEYWKMRNINRAADRDDLRAVTRLINGGYNGIEDRAQYLKKAKNVLSLESASDTPSEKIKSAQARLKELNYPLGSADGIVGPLTRSAIRDFQDANSLAINGKLDDRTYATLMSEHAVARPVSNERATLTVSDLKKSGSEVVSATEGIKESVTTATGAVAAASGFAAQVQDHVQTAKSAVETGKSLSWFWSDWRYIVLTVLVLIAAFAVYRIWRNACKVEEARLDDARSGRNVRI